jgi:Uma2 family endonuclease
MATGAPVQPFISRGTAMNHAEYLHLLGEKTALERMIAETPEEDVLDRASLTARLRQIEALARHQSIPVLSSSYVSPPGGAGNGHSAGRLLGGSVAEPMPLPSWAFVFPASRLRIETMEFSHDSLPYMTRLRRLTASEYMRMVDAGVFGARERLELIEGVLCSRSPQSVVHARIIQMLSGLIFPQLAAQYLLRVQLPLQLGELSVPEPDLAVVSRDEGIRRDSHPRSAMLLIEVARNSLREDRSTKGSLYARHGVAEFWLVDATRQRVEVYRKPDMDSAAYAESITAQGNDVLTSRAVPGLSIPLDSIW